MLYPIFAEEFPEIQPAGNLNVQVVLQPSFAPDSPKVPSVTAFRFVTTDGERSVQISKANFIYESSARYTGWADYRAKFEELWRVAEPQILPNTIIKIGLRYINRIPKSERLLNLGDWLKPTADLPEALVSSKGHFLGRIETSPEPGHLRLTTVATEATGPDWPAGAIIMDIDRINTKQFDAKLSDILEELDYLHEDVWDAFNAAATDNLKKYLAGTL